MTIFINRNLVQVQWIISTTKTYFCALVELCFENNVCECENN